MTGFNVRADGPTGSPFAARWGVGAHLRMGQTPDTDAPDGVGRPESPYGESSASQSTEGVSEFASPGGSYLVQIDSKISAADRARIEAMPRGAERKQAAWEALVANAKSSQERFVKVAESLKQSGAISGYDTLVSPNMIIVTPKSGSSSKVLQAFSVDGVRAIYDNSSGGRVYGAGPSEAQAGAGLLGIAPGMVHSNQPAVGLELPDGRVVVPDGDESPMASASRAGDTPGVDPVTGGEDLPEAPRGPTYGVQLIGAPDAWAKGADGKGLVFGSIDTGADVTHPGIKDKYRGRDGDHNYDWMDFVDGYTSPRDYDDHGTHTIGTAVGGTADSQFGVAPGAEFVSVRGLAGGRMDAGLRSIQWMQAPTKLDGSGADPTKAPDVVGMSWYMGSSSEELFRESMANLQLAGIEPVKSAGNQGPGAQTITSPGHYPEIYAVAAVDSSSRVASFSSRGNARIPAGNPWPKPDFAAPGVDVESSTPRNGYQKMSGTSMAQPHFSGAVLTILSKYPDLTHDELTRALAGGATDAGARGRDTEYGQGIINIPKALDAAAEIVASRPQRP